MSSDYGSDIGSDDIVAIESSQNVVDTESAPPSTPRKPLTPRDSNFGTPPPSSQARKRKACDNDSQETEAGSQRKKRSSLPWKTPTKPIPSLQRASSSVQQLHSPLTAPRIPPSPNYPPSSSQPTPSREPIVSYPQGKPSQGDSRGPHEGPLYRFPFGSYSGKTLLEVPGFYLSCLRIDQAMADSMPGFADALRLYDAGQPPTAPLLPPSSSQPLQGTSLKSEFVGSSSSQKTPSKPLRESISSPQKIEVRSSQTTSKESEEYRFTFGMHSGKTLYAVPANYINFLKDRGIADDRPDLKAALADFEKKAASLSVSKSRVPAAPKDPSQYTMLFGRHKGQMVSDVPDQYLAWLRTTDLLDDNADLRAAVFHEQGKRLPKKAKKGRSSTRGTLPRYAPGDYIPCYW